MLAFLSHQLKAVEKGAGGLYALTSAGPGNSLSQAQCHIFQTHNANTLKESYTMLLRLLYFDIMYEIMIMILCMRFSTQHQIHAQCFRL